ncbi:MAG TPA: hypothetical protein VK798_13870 [Alloacidobacterium sp.]|jgi:hypothetical protein|nr:hypothetical protein [Alloacidobacterium sp.]
MKAMKRNLIGCIVIALPLLVGQSLSAQEEQQASDQELNMQAYELLLRGDVSAKREAIVTQIMALSDSDAKVFWPIYREYEAERAKLDDAEAQVTNDYVKDYQTLSEDEADQLQNKTFDLEAKRAELRKKYFGIMKKALSAPTAARFFEADSQMQNIVDLQMSAKLPANQ